jgi:uncharacterized protein (TIGR02246 family)
MKTTFLVALMSAAIAGICIAVSATDETPAKAEVVANDRAYEAAYAKADVKALADFFTDDASYTTAEGRVFNGRTEIEDSIRSAFTGNKGGKLAINLDSVRVLGAEALVEKGATSVTAKNGEVSGELYTAVLVKSGDRWKINQLIESPLPDLTPREHLGELAWLVGEWEDTDKTDNVSVHSQYLWARGGNFLTRNVTVKNSGEVTLEGWQIIGWDSIDACIRSWTFDGEGGFSEGRFTRDGDRWLLRESGVTPDGDRTTAENTITKLGADRFTWESNNRTLNGEPQPSISRIEIGRMKGK